MMVSIFMCRLLLVIDFVVVFAAAEAGWIAVKIRFEIAFSAGVIVGMKTSVAEHELFSAARAEDSITVVVNVPCQGDFAVAVGADFGLLERYVRQWGDTPFGVPSVWSSSEFTGIIVHMEVASQATALVAMVVQNLDG